MAGQSPVRMAGVVAGALVLAGSVVLPGPPLVLTAAAQEVEPSGMDVAEPMEVPEGFVYIAPGTFVMGSPVDEPLRSDDEALHTVTVTRGFFLQATEVTQGQWQQWMGSNPSHFANCGPDCPVEQVTRLDAIAYANARSRAEGLRECYDAAGNVRGRGGILACEGYRLPTEAEWEFAARAGTGGAVCVDPVHAGAPAELSAQAWYDANSDVTWEGGMVCTSWGGHPPEQERTCGPQPVAQRAANACGLFDMLGNVWEWTHDWYASYDGDATDPTGPARGTFRVLRGGAWDESERGTRPAARLSLDDPTTRNINLGFRLARSAP